MELTILADELAPHNSVDDAHANTVLAEDDLRLAGVKIIRCWRVDSMANPARILRVVRALNPDVVWFNLVFSSFGTPGNPVAAFLGLSAPALTRAAGFYTHVTLHHIVEHIDFKSAIASGGSREKILRKGTDAATWALLKANSVSVLLSDYRRTLVKKYSARNVVTGTHGIFTTISKRPEMSRRANPEHRILAFGKWGTYKRLEKLMEAFPSILEKIPNARLIVAGGNHPAATGYWESVRAAQTSGLPVDFLGYIPDKDIPDLFRTSSLLIMPYDSSTGSSGPAHQACEYGLPIVCADIPDFRCMSRDDDIAILFYKLGDIADLAEKVVTVLESPQLQFEMSNHNYEAGIHMTMTNVARTYIRWFELQKLKREVPGRGTIERLRGNFWSFRYLREVLPSSSWSLRRNKASTEPGVTELGSSRMPVDSVPSDLAVHALDNKKSSTPENYRTKV